MRKYTIFLLIILAVSIIFNSAYASTLNIDFNNETYAITVTGEVLEHADSRVMIQILSPGMKESDIEGVTENNLKDIFSNIFEVQTDSKGHFEAPSYIPSKSGSYSIRVKYDDGSPAFYENAFLYFTKDYEENVFLPGINAESGAASQYIIDNADLVCGFDANYKYLSEENLKKAAECAVAERNLSLSAKFDSRKTFETVMKAAIMINLMEQYQTKAFDIFEFYAKDAELQKMCSPFSLCGEYVSADSTALIVADAINGNDFTTVTDFANEIGEGLILKAIADVDVYMNVETILMQQEDFFDFNLDGYKKINDKTSVNEAISKSNPKNISELKSVIKTEVEKHKSDGKVSYGGSGGSSSGKAPSSFGGANVGVNITPGTSGSASLPATDVNASTGLMPFADLTDVPWAKEAIENLRSKGIINGTSDNTYSPQRNVTREEFVKLLTQAFVSQLSTEDVDFSDVNSQDWFYPYIADAYSRGLIKGITASAFGAGTPVTRQDMAVMAYRYALSFGSSDAFSAEKSFSDSQTISDYAKEAVHKLSGAGVINGMGSGSFEPGGYCNRAQAAVVIYNLINFMEGK